MVALYAAGLAFDDEWGGQRMDGGQRMGPSENQLGLSGFSQLGQVVGEEREPDASPQPCGRHGPYDDGVPVFALEGVATDAMRLRDP